MILSSSMSKFFSLISKKPKADASKNVRLVNEMLHSNSFVSIPFFRIMLHLLSSTCLIFNTLCNGLQKVFHKSALAV